MMYIANDDDIDGVIFDDQDGDDQIVEDDFLLVTMTVMSIMKFQNNNKHFILFNLNFGDILFALLPLFGQKGLRLRFVFGGACSIMLL